MVKKVGDCIEKDQNIAIISTDKLEAEIPSPANGTIISINVPEGIAVKTETILAVIKKKNIFKKNI